MGALLDHRPGVVTKGFRTLAHEQDQEESWELDQLEEDEASCDSFSSVSVENSTCLDLPRSTSTPSVCRNKNYDTDDISQLKTLRGEMHGAKDAIQGKDGHAGNSALPFSSNSPCSSDMMNGHVDLKELQALQSASVDRMPGEGAC